jgi:hypothetical protein
VRAAAARIKNWREDRGILRFIDEQFQVSLDPWQEQAALLFASPKPEHRRISLQACAGPGKSAVLAWCGLWFLGCQGETREHPQGAAVSISEKNLKDNLWKELLKWHAVSPYVSAAFTCTSERIFANDHPSTWFLSARSWPKTANADEQGATLSGLHSKYVVTLIDESGAIPPSVLNAANQSLLRCDIGKILQAGNPISLEGMLHAAANELRPQWNIIVVTGDPDDPHAWVNSPRFAAQHVSQGPCGCPRCESQTQIDQFGRDNPWVKSYILGQFPSASINSLLGLEDVTAAMSRTLQPHQYIFSQKRLGIDVARFGDDRTTLCPRQGLQAFPAIVMRHATTNEIAARAVVGQQKWAKGRHPDDVLMLVDATGGYGAGVIDNLKLAGRSVISVEYAGKPNDPKFFNKRSEIGWELAEWVKRGGALPNDSSLPREFTGITYTFKSGKLLLEPKEVMKKRLGYSPDLWDGYANTCALPDMPADVEMSEHFQVGRSQKAKTMDDLEA